MTTYTVVTDWSRERMVAEVNKMLSGGLGWTPCGGVSVSRTENEHNGYITYVYAQALSKVLAPPEVVRSAESEMYALDANGQKCYYGVMQCPGIGAATEALMAGHQIYYLYELVGQFLCLQRDQVVFGDWLCLNFPSLKGVNLQRCVEAIAGYKNIKV